MKELPIKNEFASGLLELSRLASTERVDTSRKVSAKPVWLLSCCVEVNNAEEKSQVRLHNGETTGGTLVYVLKAQYAHSDHAPGVPVYFNKGLYVELTDNADALTIQYLVDSP